MNIVYINIDEIKPYEKNPRKNDQAVDAVANSIKEFGFKVPIVIDQDGTIVAGHTRYKAAKKLKMESVPCIIADDLTPEQVKAYRLADNKVGESSEWDMGLLDQELDGIFDLDMRNFGFLEEEEEKKERRDISDDLLMDEYKLIVDGTEEQLNQLYDELMSRGYQCKIST